jgi:hypothetical protein
MYSFKPPCCGIEKMSTDNPNTRNLLALIVAHPQVFEAATVVIRKKSNYNVRRGLIACPAVLEG